MGKVKQPARGNMADKDGRKEEEVRLNAAAYIRLSKEDGDKSESLSVANQRMLLTEFVKKHRDLYLYDVYVDDGYTGTNFVEVR